MDVHDDARLTPFGRCLMIARIEQGWAVPRACEASGVSVRTAYCWLGRHRRREGLQDRSSTPLGCPHRVPAERVAEIERLRRTRMLPSPA